MPAAQAARLAAQVVVAIGRILSYNIVEILWTGGGAVHIAICDDNPIDLQQLHGLLQQYDSHLQIATFSAARELYESESHFDAVILDIEMQAPNGFEIAMRMAKQESHPIILFATNSAAYAVRGYGLALRYLLKPLTEDALSEAMDAVKEALSRSRLTVNIDGVTHVLNVQDIRYAEVLGHRVTLHVGSDKLTLRGSMKEIGSLLPGRWFCAPHQSYLVNLLHVRTIAKDAVYLDDGTHLPLSRRKQAEFLQAFHAFLGVDAW